MMTREPRDLPPIPPPPPSPLRFVAYLAGAAAIGLLLALAIILGGGFRA